MAVSDFIIQQTTSNMSTRISGDKVVAKLENVDSRIRYTFGLDNVGLAETVDDALYNIDGCRLEYAYHGTGLDILISDDDMAQISERLSVYDVLREYTGDAEMKPVKNRTISNCDSARAQVIGEYWPVDSRGNAHLRGIRVAFWYVDDDNNVDDDGIQYFDFACDKNGHISQKSYGIGALWDIAKPELETHAKAFAMECRARTHMYTRTRYALIKLVEGIAVRK
jgi:hypothetical protein